MNDGCGKVISKYVSLYALTKYVGNKCYMKPIPLTNPMKIHILFKNVMSYLSLLPLGDGELVVDPEPRVEPDLGGDPDLQVDVGAHLLKVLPVGHDARPVAVVVPGVGCSQVVCVGKAKLNYEDL